MKLDRQGAGDADGERTLDNFCHRTVDGKRQDWFPRIRQGTGKPMRSTKQERRRNSRADELFNQIISLVAAFQAEYMLSTLEQVAWIARLDQYVHTKIAQLERQLDGEKTGAEARARGHDRAGIEVITNEPLSAVCQDEKKRKWCALWRRAADLIVEFEVEHATSDDSAWASRVAVHMRSKVAAMEHDLQFMLSEMSSVLPHSPSAVMN